MFISCSYHTPREVGKGGMDGGPALLSLRDLGPFHVMAALLQKPHGPSDPLHQDANKGRYRMKDREWGNRTL